MLQGISSAILEEQQDEKTRVQKRLRDFQF